MDNRKQTSTPKAAKPALTPEQKIAMEMKREKDFVRLANARANRILHAIETLGNLNGPAYRHMKQNERMIKIAKALVEKIENNVIPKKATATEAFNVD